MRLRGLSQEAIEARVSARDRARAERDFVQADAIRAELLALGVSVRDGAGPSEWTLAQ
jgi:cysteinyl-tRNA synthetase